MDILKAFVDFALKILNIYLDVFGYRFSLMQFCVWFVIAGFLIWFIREVFD